MAAACPILASEARAPPPGEFAPSAVETMPHGVKIPDRLPDFSLQDRDGKPVSIKTWAGKSLVINFWATWCAPCRREIPLLEDAATRLGRPRRGRDRHRRRSPGSGARLRATT